MKLRSVVSVYLEDYPALKFEVEMEDETRTGYITSYQKRNVFEDTQALYLGAAFEDQVSVRVSKDEQEGQPGRTLAGYWQNDELAQAFRWFVEATNNGKFKKGVTDFA